MYNTARPRFDLSAVRADLASLQYPQPTAEEVIHFTREDNRPPSLEEVEKAVHSLKDEKASGPDSIPPEYVKYAGRVMVIWLLHLYTLIWTTGHIPVEWTMSIIVCLYKGAKAGARTDPNAFS